MGLRQRLRRLLDDKKDVVEKASKIEKQSLRIDALGRIADLKESEAEITIEVERNGGDGSGFQNKNFEIEDVEPLAFRELIFDSLGGGSYKLVFRKPDGRLLLRSDTSKPETHKIKVGGKAKGKSKAEKAAKKNGDATMYQMMMENQAKNIELVTTMQNTMITALLANMGNGKGDPAAMIKTVTEAVKDMKEVAGDGGIDPLSLVSGVMQLMKQYDSQTRAPVQTTGSNSSGLEKFFEGLGAAVPAFAPMIAAKLNPAAAAPPLLPANSPAFAGAEPPNMPEAAPTSTTPAGVPPPAGAAPLNALDALSAPLGPVEGGPSDPSYAVYGAVMKLRYVIAQRDDPYSIAAEMVDCINLMRGAQRIGGRWQNHVNEENAGAMFDQYAPMIPEFTADPEFMAQCRAALIQAVHEQLGPDSDIEAEEVDFVSAEREEEAANEIHDSTHESGQGANSGPQAEHDRAAGRPGNHDREDSDGGIDG